MKRTLVITVTTVLVTLLLVGIAAAQTGALAGLAQPLLITIDQVVPADVTLAIQQEDGAVLTTTVPITVGVSLQIKIDGAQVVSVAPVADAEPAAIDVATAPASAASDQVDAAGRAYTTELPATITLDQVESSLNSLDGIEIIGDITNIGEEETGYVELIFTLYAADGSILGVENTYAKLQAIAPGQTSPFRLMTTSDGADVATYRIQVEGD